MDLPDPSIADPSDEMALYIAYPSKPSGLQVGSAYDPIPLINPLPENDIDDLAREMAILTGRRV